MAFVVCRRAFFFGAIASDAKTNAAAGRHQWADLHTLRFVCSLQIMNVVGAADPWGWTIRGWTQGEDPGGEMGPRGNSEKDRGREPRGLTQEVKRRGQGTSGGEPRRGTREREPRREGKYKGGTQYGRSLQYSHPDFGNNLVTIW